MKRHALIAGAAMFFGAAAFAAVKPLAIWNGEFESKYKSDTEIQVARNGVNLVRNAGLICYTTYFKIGTTKGMVVKSDSGVTIAQAIIANIDLKSVTKPTDYRVLFDYATGNTEKYWLQLDSSWKIGAATPSGSDASWLPSDDAVESSVLHSFAIFIPNGEGKSYGLLDGVPVHENTFAATGGEICIGSRYSINNVTAQKSIANAKVSYVAVFPDDSALSLDDFKTWSLYEMTSAETVADGGSIAGGAGVGVNLLGGTYKVEGVTKAHALFVQEDSTIEFSQGSSLALAGPVYIAPGRNRKLTLTLADGASSASLTSPHFADAGQISAVQGITVSAPEPSAPEVADDVAAPVEFSGGDLGIWMKTKPNYWYAPVVGADPVAVKDSVVPSENPVKATDDKTKIAVPYDGGNVIYYKIISAPSQEDFGTAD